MRIVIDLIGKKALKTKYELYGTIKIYILNKICVKRIDLYRISKNSINKNTKINIDTLKNKELIREVINIVKTIKINKLDANIGFNLNEIIVNSYCIAFISSLLSIVKAKNNSKNIIYRVYTSDKLLEVKIKSIIVLPLVKNINSIVKILKIFLKGGIKNGRKTSNRISNDYINDIN
jgi:hypothetical protein